MNPRRKKAFIMAAVAAVSAVTMGFTALAAYNNVGGYEKVKQGLINLMTKTWSDNYTLKGGASGVFDGVTMENIDVALYVNGEDSVAEITNYNSSGEIEYTHTTYVKDGYTIDPMTDWAGSSLEEDGANWYVSGGRGFSYSSILNMSGLGDEVTPAQTRFFSALMDLLAGDTKNYFTYNNGHISVTLGETQVPEIFRAGLGVLNEYYARYDESAKYGDYGYGDYSDDKSELLRQMLSTIRVTLVNLDADVDADGNITNVAASMTFEGSDAYGVGHKVTVSGTFSLTDINSTVVNTPNIIGEKVSLYGQTFIMTKELWDSVLSGDFWSSFKPDWQGDTFDDYYDGYDFDYDSGL